VAEHHPTGAETTPPYAPRSSRFGSEPPSVEDDVDVWRYAMSELHARNDDDSKVWALLNSDVDQLVCFSVCLSSEMLQNVYFFHCEKLFPHKIYANSAYSWHP